MGEAEVIRAVWDKVGGELIEEFRAPTVLGAQPRWIDAVFAVDKPRRYVGKYCAVRLNDRRVVVCQAKSGRLDLGVLGQTLFGAKLIQEQHTPRSMRLIAAAVNENPLIDRLLEAYMPFERHIEGWTCPSLEPGRSSGEERYPRLSREKAAALHREYRGLLIEPEDKRSSVDYSRVRAAATNEPLRHADPDAIILPARRFARAAASEPIDVAADEPVILSYTSKDFYMTTMGRAVFGGELARCLLGLADVTSVFTYGKDDDVLRGLLKQMPHVRVHTG